MNQPKVFVTRSDFPLNGIELLKERFHVVCYPHPSDVTEQYLLENVPGSSAIFCLSTNKITKEILNAGGPKLRVVATMSLGVEHIDIEECKRRKIYVCNTVNPIYVAIVAEFTVGLLLSVARKIVSSSGAIKRGEWMASWKPDWYRGRGLTNSSVGIIGMGRIGQAVLDRILPFGVSKVLYYDVINPISQAEAKGAQFATFENLLKESDFVIVNCNLTEESRGMFDSKAFSLMKRTAVLINTSRGGVIDQEALINALKNGVIKAAGIDVMYPEPLPKDHELTDVPNLVITPHIAGSEELSMEIQCNLTAENIIEVLQGHQPITPVF